MSDLQYRAPEQLPPFVGGQGRSGEDVLSLGELFFTYAVVVLALAGAVGVCWAVYWMVT